MQLVYEAVAIGVLVVVVGVVVSNLVGMFHNGTKTACKDWNKNHVMEITLFFIGVAVHLVCEFTGVNKWYCKNGNACKSQ